MDEKGNFLKPITGKLSSAGIPFMLMGSLAATSHGHPRATMDIDLVVDADEETLCRFARNPGHRFYFNALIRRISSDLPSMIRMSLSLITKSGGGTRRKFSGTIS